MRRTLIKTVLMYFIIALLLPGAAASAAQLQAISVSPSSGLAGITVAVSGASFTPGIAILQWDGANQIVLTISAGGTFSTKYTIPAGASPGKHLITVCWSPDGKACQGGEFAQMANAAFEVLIPAPALLPTDTPSPLY
jgi:hypothetical protein